MEFGFLSYFKKKSNFANFVFKNGNWRYILEYWQKSDLCQYSKIWFLYPNQHYIEIDKYWNFEQTFSDPYDSSDMRRSSSGQDEEEDDDMLERPLEDEDDSLGKNKNA